jgi:hypothetical protein
LEEVSELLMQIEEKWDTPFSPENQSKKEIEMNVNKVVRPMKIGVRQDRDQVCLNTSHKRNGLGKSALSYWEMRRNEPKKFQIDRNYIFKGGLKEIVSKSDSLPLYSAMTMDEILRLLYKRRSVSSESIDVVEWLGADQRKTNQILIGNIPDFRDIDKYLREGKVRFWIDCLERGVGVMFEADEFLWVEPWHEDDFEKIVKKRKHGVRESLMDKIELLKTHSCFKSLIFWADFPTDDKIEYLRLVKHYTGIVPSEEKKIEEESQEILRSRAGIAAVRLVNMFVKKGAARNFVIRESGWSDSEYKRFSELERKASEMQKQNIQIA